MAEALTEPNPADTLLTASVKWRLTKDTNAPKAPPEQVLDCLECKTFSKCIDASGSFLSRLEFFSTNKSVGRKEN